MTNHLLTRDHIAKRLEIEAIARYVKDGMTVLDVGCGDGETAIELAQRYDVIIEGLDSDATFVERASVAGTDAFWRGLFKRKGYQPMFIIGDILALSDWGKGNYDLVKYDLVYTQRCLVCLPDWETQKRAIANIARCLKPGGLYVMCECSQDGLDAVNAMRECIGLPPIVPPAWDRYLRDAEIEPYRRKIARKYLGRFPQPMIESLTLEGIDDYSSTYYFLSRVVNARLAADEGREPDYDAPVNRLALTLPPIAGLRGQGRVWLWRKA